MLLMVRFECLELAQFKFLLIILDYINFYRLNNRPPKLKFLLYLAKYITLDWASKETYLSGV